MSSAARNLLTERPECFYFRATFRDANLEESSHIKFAENVFCSLFLAKFVRQEIEVSEAIFTTVQQSVFKITIQIKLHSVSKTDNILSVKREVFFRVFVKI